MQREKNAVYYADFGAAGDGKTNDFEPLFRAHEYANEKGLAVFAEPTKSYYISDTRIDLTITPNTTGVVRSGSILVNSYFSIGMNVNQLHWLNITNPVGRMITIDENGDELSKEQQYCVFERNTIAEQHNFEVAFTTYSELATLESDVDWLTFESEEFAAGSHTLIITCKANPTIEKRVGTLKLTSNGVSNSIVITQERKKDL